MENDEKKSQSWWSTVPGTITAIATLITAIGGLVVILQSMGVLSHSGNSLKDSTTMAKSAVTDSIAAPIHLDEKLIIQYRHSSYDLDSAKRTEDSALMDFAWERPTSTDYEIKPDLGKFRLLGKEQNFDDVDLPQLDTLQYSKDAINSDLLMKGAVVAVITKEKRFGKFIVEKNTDGALIISLIIYDNDNDK